MTKHFFLKPTWISLFLFFSASFGLAEEFKSKLEKTSYALGANIGKSFKHQQIDVDLETLIDGLKDGLKDKSKMSDEEIRTLLVELQQASRSRQEQARDLAFLENQKAEAAFLKDIDKKKGVQSTPSGLRYEILKKGTGAVPKLNQNVKTHYKGTLTDGTEFDSSYKRGTPAVFGLSKVIKGWTEALQLMPVGSKWKLYVPSSLGYGKNPPPGSPIKAGSLLVFEVELLEIVN